MPSPLASILQHLRSEPSRTWSIVITVFGDAVVPRGGSLWLGSLLGILAGMDIASGVVRTAMSRLASDDWLERTRIGRNSFYRLTPKGQASSATAAERIYGAPPSAWDGQFRLLLADSLARPDTTKNVLRDGGFGVLGPGIWLAPRATPVPAEAAALLQLQSMADRDTARQLAARAWSLSPAAKAYQRFLGAFAPLEDSIAGPGEPSGLDALVARILLIHEYRRIVLRDPGLPLPLLPDDWPGTRARQLCAHIYQALLPASERWLDRHGRDENGPLPPPTPDLRRRFGSSLRVTELG